MLNYYQVLGVPHDASDKIIKIAYEGKTKALVKAGLSEIEARKEQRLLDQAYATLFNPAKRSWHDKQLATQQVDEVESARTRSRKGWVAAGIMSILFVAAMSYVAVERVNQREQIRLEELRIANAKAKEDARAAEEEQRLANERASLAYRREADASRNYARDRAYLHSYDRYSRDWAFTDDVRSRTLNSWDTRERQREEDRTRYLAEADQRKAWQDVERQKRFVAEREREEERVRLERHYKAQREADVNRSRAVAETETGLVPSRTRINKGPGFLPPTY
jgi:hypothetical protein